MTTKSVSYAYPSSPAAVRCGYGKTGCFLVSYVIGPRVGKVIAESPFKTKEGALKHAYGCPEPWNWFSMREEGTPACCEAWLKWMRVKHLAHGVETVIAYLQTKTEDELRALVREAGSNPDNYETEDCLRVFLGSEMLVKECAPFRPADYTATA